MPPTPQRDLVLSHLRLADAISRRFARHRNERADLQQVAYLGLVLAAKRFDTSVSTNFAAYAVPTIEGEIKRFLRDSSWAVRPPRPIQELHLRVHIIAPHLSQTLGREPSSADLARALADQPENIDAALEAGKNRQAASLDGVVGEDSAPRKFSVAIADTERGFEEAERAILIRQLCQQLTESECHLLRLRFFDDLSQQQIADQLGVTQMQVSRQLKKILGKLWAQLQRCETTADSALAPDELSEAS